MRVPSSTSHGRALLALILAESLDCNKLSPLYPGMVWGASTLIPDVAEAGPAPRVNLVSYAALHGMEFCENCR